MPGVVSKFALCLLSAIMMSSCGGPVSDMAADQCGSLGFRPGTGIYGECIDQKKAEIRTNRGDPARGQSIERVSN